MSATYTDTSSIAEHNLQGVPVTRIFIAAFITQLCMGFEVLLRANAATAIKSGFFDATNPLNSGNMIGEVLGALFLGFAISNFAMAPLVDGIGLRRTHILSVLLYLGGTFSLLLATPESSYAYYLLWGGSLLQGLAWGSIEAVLNPLVVTIYPRKKVQMLNWFHGAYAVGVVIAAPCCTLVETFSLGWKLQLALVFIPAIAALALIARVKYPVTERVAAGVSFSGMFKHTFTRRLFYFFIFTMFITSASEIATVSWIDLTLSKVIGFQGFWLVAFIFIIHALTRLFAGVLDRLLGSAGILFCGSLLTFIGLALLSRASGPGTAFLAAVLFGMGTCVLWPTTLVGISERFPKGGALAIGVMASAGMLASYVIMPAFGKLFDNAKIAIAGGAEAFTRLQEGTPAHDEVMIGAASSMFQTISWLPLIAVILYAGLCIYELRAKRAAAASA